MRAYVDKVNDPWLEYDVDLTPGGSYELLKDEFGIGGLARPLPQIHQLVERLFVEVRVCAHPPSRRGRGGCAEDAEEREEREEREEGTMGALPSMKSARFARL